MLVVLAFALLLVGAAPLARVAQRSSARPAPDVRRLQSGAFALTFDDHGVSGLANPDDPFKAGLLAPGGHLAAVVKYRVEGGDWFDIYQEAPRVESQPASGSLTFSNDVPGTVLKSVQSFRTDGRALDWTIEVANRMDYPVELGDFAFAIPWKPPTGEDPNEIFERSWTKHQFVSGHGSFIYFVRPNGEPPYLVMTMQPATKLEYYASPGGRGSAFAAFVHSALTGGAEKRGT
jgi:hypothetical protein